MEGHMHEHGCLYNSVPFVLFVEEEWVGGGAVVWCGEVWWYWCWCCCCCCIRLSFFWSDASHFHSNCGLCP